MKKLFLLFAIISLFSSCKKDELILNSENGRSTFPQIRGQYEYKYYWSDSYCINEQSEYISYTFDNTRTCQIQTSRWSYSTSSGWLNAIKKSYIVHDEWKIENNNLLIRAVYADTWNNSYEHTYGEWEQHQFQYINDSTIIIDNITLTKKL